MSDAYTEIQWYGPPGKRQYRVVTYHAHECWVYNTYAEAKEEAEMQAFACGSTVRDLTKEDTDD